MRLPMFTVVALTLPALVPAQSPATANVNGIVCYDQARQRLLVGTGAGDLWEADGVHWALSSARVPGVPRRAIHHPARRTSLWLAANTLFEFDGHTFTDRGPLPLNVDAGIAIDTQRNRLVVLDAVGTTVRLREWDGQAWFTAPALGGSAVPLGLAYDEARQRCVITTLRLSGGVGYDTVEWDGQAFTSTPVSNSVRRSLAYDPVRQQVVSFGSVIEGWNGAQWGNLQIQNPIVPGQLAADPANGRVYAYANVAGRFEFWAWQGAGWSFAQRSNHAVVLTTGFSFDAARSQAVLLGPTSGSQMAHHEWGGSHWVDRAGPTTPTARQGHAQVYDPVRGETLVFGGTTAGGDTNELWAFDGTQWTLRSTTGPSPRHGARLAFDSIRGDVVLVGGLDGSAVQSSDFWRWNGLAWTLVQATNPLTTLPGPLGFDPLRDVLVMVDGFGLTYEYSAAGWALAATTVISPPPSLVFDPRRGRIVAVVDSVNRHEWTGTQWAPIPGGTGVLAYDPGRGVMLNYLTTRLLVESAQPASAEHLGVGCGGATIGTSLTAFGRPRPGSTDLHLDLRAEATQRPVMLGFGFAGPSTPIGNGCTLQLGATFGSRVWFTDAAGLWHAPFPIPNSLPLRGAVLAVQAGVLDPASAGGFGLSNGLRLTVGD